MRTKNDLYKQHAAAHGLGQRALSTFKTIAAELREAAERHASVAVSSQLQINDLVGLRDSAAEAAEAATRQADAIEALTQ